jgi:glycosyltransferase involved in cell wall biosynthesis
MATCGINTVRVYTVPPRWLLDLAAGHGLRVMVGLPWEQHVTFLDDADRATQIIARVREGVRSCAGHPAILAYAVGNEIPAPIVRWHGHRRVERFVRRLYEAVKGEDAGALVTYVNYPSTEYLYLPFLDFACFNVYLESRERLEAYLARLQNIAGDRPLVMAEIGLDSLRNGEARQAQTLEWQIQSVLSSGCAGMFVFAWTDEWHRGGQEIDDWRFGLTTRERTPRASLDVVRRVYADAPFPVDRSWPHVSVVVCTRNGARTIRRTLAGVAALEYPNFETIVVDDGSTDETARIVKGFDAVRLISVPPQGLSVARNVGLAAAEGEIIAYLDDDAWPDEHWLMYLADAFAHGDHAGIGGPNIAPAGDGLVAEGVSRSPGNPTHVLLTDRMAEHIPGCNMAFRTARLREIRGFDPQFTIAGDDVDVCWRIQERGWTLGFTAGAMVWHHRRASIRRYWRQQYNYGAAEGMLARKWPQRYTAGGRAVWSGRLYDPTATRALGHSRRRIYHGTWGSALFQSVYQPAATVWISMGLMPEWYLLVAALGAAAIGGLWWRPMLWALPLLVLALLVPVIQSIIAAGQATFIESTGRRAIRARAMTALLHLIQPVARFMGRARCKRRLVGRVYAGTLAWTDEVTAPSAVECRKRGVLVLPWRRTVSVWHERWRSAEERLAELERRLRAGGLVVLRGGSYDRWDLELRGGTLGGARLRMTIEEHGAGKQMARYCAWPAWTARAWAWTGGVVLAAGGLAGGGMEAAGVGVSGVALLFTVLAVAQYGRALAAVRGALGEDVLRE